LAGNTAEGTNAMSGIQNSSAAQELRTLRDMLIETLAELDRPVVYGVDPDLPAGQLAQVLWRSCGRRKALIVSSAAR